MKKSIQINEKNVSLLLLAIVVTSVSFMLISNILANRMIQIGGWSMDAGTLTFPITYVISDILSEVYGYKWSRRVAWVSALMNLLCVLFIFIATSMPAPEWFDAAPFSLALKSSFRIVVASVTSYVVGDWVNDIIFEAMRKKSIEGKGFKFRAIASSIGGSLVDTSLFVLIAFIFTMPYSEIIPMILLNVIVKTTFEVLVLPITDILMKIVRKHESY